MPDCRYYGRFCETNEDLAEHLAEANDEQRMEQFDTTLDRLEETESSAEYSRRRRSSVPSPNTSVAVTTS